VGHGAWDELDAERLELIARAHRYADRGLDVHAQRLGAGGPLPPRLADTPMVVDTGRGELAPASADAGPGGMEVPSSLVAPVAALPALLSPDSTGLGADPAVALAVAAAVPSLALVLAHDGPGADRARLVLDGAGRPDVPVAIVDAADEAVAAVAAGGGPWRWVGLGSTAGLAGLLDRRPDLADQLVLTQLVTGPVAGGVVAAVRRPWLVICPPGVPALVVAAAMQLPFVEFALQPDGSFVSGHLHAAPFQAWLDRTV
jgi:hypothetical protein